MATDVMREEAGHLLETQERFREVIEDEKLLYDSLPSMYRDSPDLLGDLMLRSHNRIARLGQGISKPYFARIDFTDGASGARERCYLGKIGVSDADNHIITVDWRAPVSTLYYDSSIGPAQYEAPGGVVRGTLDLKRQIEVEHGELKSVRDVDTVSNDELLSPYLGVNADNRLKNIVASIQGEQNRIIREKLERTLVVQGAAGSGKTTVALHRIAYLAYTYRDTVRSGQFLVIGPNPTFIRYISSVLPDLDVDRVPQYTFDQLAREVIGEEFSLTDRYQRLREVLDGADTGGIERWKTSMQCRDALESFLRRFEESVVPVDGFSVRGFPVLSRAEVAHAWAEARVTDEGTILARVERCVLMLSGVVRRQQDFLEERLSLRFREGYRSAKDERDLARMHRDRAAIEKELEAGCARTLRAYFSRVDQKLLSVYREFIQGEDCPPGRLREETIKRLRKRTLTPEDLAALLYLRERIRGCGEWKQFRHAVVDEAQDYGEFELYVLRRVLSGSTFTVVGDLAQSIFGYRSIESWEPVLREALPGAQLCEMQKSYRTTVEIMRAANAVTRLLGLRDAQPVIRHGEPVAYHDTSGGNAAAVLLGLVNGYLAMGFESVAVIGRDDGEVRRAAGELRALGLDLPLVDGEGEEAIGGALALTAYQAKGLEFDAAILIDASEAVYHSSSRTDMHLLYVAMTRPLHRLDVLHSGPLTAPLA